MSQHLSGLARSGTATVLSDQDDDFNALHLLTWLYCNSVAKCTGIVWASPQSVNTTCSSQQRRPCSCYVPPKESCTKSSDDDATSRHEKLFLLNYLAALTIVNGIANCDEIELLPHQEFLHQSASPATTTSTMLSESTSKSSVKFLSSSTDAAGIPATSSSFYPASTSTCAVAFYFFRPLAGLFTVINRVILYENWLPRLVGASGLTRFRR